MNYKESTKESRRNDWHNFIEEATKRHAPVDKVLNEHFDNIKQHVIKTGSLEGLDKVHIKAELAASLRPAIKQVTNSAGQYRLDDLYEQGLLKEEKVFLPSRTIEELVDTRLAVLANTVETTWDRIKATLESKPEDLATEIGSTLFDQKELINTTEATALNNAADLEAVNQSEVPLLKIWVSQQDDKVRDSHTEAEDKYQDGIPLDEEFEVGNDSMLNPGEGSEPEENINCRCSISYIESKGQDYMDHSGDSVSIPNITYSGDHNITDSLGLRKLSMPRPVVEDPKSKLTDVETKRKQAPMSDDKHSLDSGFKEEKDLSGITYGTSVGKMKVKEPVGGLQRALPSAYAETLDHKEYPQKASELVSAMGVGISADRTLTDLPPKDIKADLAGEQQMKRDEPIYSEGEEDDDGMWVTAFKSGTQTDSDGVAHKWEPEDIDNIAQQYNKAVDPKNPEHHIAPVVLGHPKDDSPAMGWIDKAKAVSGKLFVHLSQLQPEFVDALKKGLYKTRSISLYPDLNIRHLGFLGGAVPAVKGLGPFKFQDEKPFKTYEFGEDMTDVNELKQENHFFKRLFNLFKIDISNFKEGTSKQLQSQDVETTKTIGDKYPEGATMAEKKESTINPAIGHMDHLKYAKEYITKLGDHIAAAKAEQGTQKSDKTPKTEVKEGVIHEFAKLAHHHMSLAHSAITGAHCGHMDHAEDDKTMDHKEKKEEVKPNEHLKNAADSLKAAHEALTGGDMEKVHEHLTASHANLALAATKSGNFKEADDVVGTAGTKEIPVTEVKKDKDENTKLAEELSVLKDEISKLKLENEKLKADEAQEQKEKAMGNYKEFCEALVAEGRMKPVDVEQNVRNLEARKLMFDMETKNFAEGATKVAVHDYVEEYKNYLSAMPKVIELDKELLKGTSPAQQPAADFVEEEINKLMKADPKLQYHEALNKLSQTHPDKVSSYVEASFQK